MGFSRQTFAIREYIILFYRERDWGLDSFHSPETIVQLTNLYWRCTGYCTVRWTGKTEESSSQVFFFFIFSWFSISLPLSCCAKHLVFQPLGPFPFCPGLRHLPRDPHYSDHRSVPLFKDNFKKVEQPQTQRHRICLILVVDSWEMEPLALEHK